MRPPYTLSLLALACIIASTARAHADDSHPPDPAQAHAADGYRLVWSDEFTADGPLDPKKWTHERGFIRNNELQWYREDNARCKDGVLVIEARRERLANPDHDAEGRHWAAHRTHADYTSASVTTQDRARWQYGRFEMRGRIDVRLGMWPAWWTLGVDDRWPVGGEIDMMEFYRGTLLANAAWASRHPIPHWDSVRTPLAELGEKWADEFHVWTMDWDKDRIALSCDGRLLNEIDLAKTVNDTPDGKNPFRQPHFMLLCLAIGGDNGGDPADTDFPAKFEVDYVRVYQK